MDITRDFARLTEKLKDSKAVAVPLRTLDSDEEIFIYGLITKALVYAGQPQLDGTMQLVMTELLKNAEEAVLKRVYAEYFAKETELDKPEFVRAFRLALKENLKELRAVLQKQQDVNHFLKMIEAQYLGRKQHLCLRDFVVARLGVRNALAPAYGVITEITHRAAAERGDGNRHVHRLDELSQRLERRTRVALHPTIDDQLTSLAEAPPDRARAGAEKRISPAIAVRFERFI